MEEDEQPEDGPHPQRIAILLSAIGRFDINTGDDNGETLLHIAVTMRDVEVATVLLHAGASVNVEDNNGNTPFSYAIDTGSPQLIELLLRFNPDFDMAIVRDKFFACLMSSASDDEKIVKMIVQKGFAIKESDITTSSMLWASILLCLQDLAISFVNYRRDFLSCLDTWYKSFLLLSRPYTETQTEMLRIISNVREHFRPGIEIDSSGNHNFDLFKILLSESDIELFNVSVMSLGQNFGDDEESDIVAMTTQVLLSSYDARNPVCDEKGKTGLHYAAQVGNVALIQALLDLHLDINHTDNDGKSPLEYAYKKIIELSNEQNDQAHNNEKHYHAEYNCWFTLIDLKISAVVLLKHISKMIAANSYITLRNLQIVKKLLKMMNKDEIVMQYYMSIYAYIEHCEEEISLLRSKKLVELTYFDFITRSCDSLAAYTKRSEVIQAFQVSDAVQEEFKIFGTMLQHKFNQSNYRRGLLEYSEGILFDIMKWLQVPLNIVRDILCNLSNDELADLVLKA